jgi:3-oxoacyl-[acyl-carrier-protein] synthase-3
VIKAVGSYLPEQVVTNHDLVARGVDTSHEWIFQRTGIEQRHVAGEGEFTSDLAVKAAKIALERASLSVDDIDMIVVGTTTPDNVFPSTAARVQAKLGMKAGACAFDVQAVCSGFVYALTMADNALRLGQAKRALVIGAETLSRLIDWQDRSTCFLFGDGAGAVILEAQESAGDLTDRGIISTHLHTDGYGYDHLYVDGGPGSTGTAGKMRMDGPEVFRHAVTRLSQVVDEALAANGFTGTDIDWLVPHQANLRIIQGLAKKLKLSPERVVMTISQHANTSAASIPLALDSATSKGSIERGQLLLLDAMGGGFTWGAVLVRY